MESILSLNWRDKKDPCNWKDQGDLGKITSVTVGASDFRVNWSRRMGPAGALGTSGWSFRELTSAVGPLTSTEALSLSPLLHQRYTRAVTVLSTAHQAINDGAGTPSQITTCTASPPARQRVCTVHITWIGGFTHDTCRPLLPTQSSESVTCRCYVAPCYHYLCACSLPPSDHRQQHGRTRYTMQHGYDQVECTSSTCAGCLDV